MNADRSVPIGASRRGFASPWQAVRDVAAVSSSGDARERAVPNPWRDEHRAADRGGAGPAGGGPHDERHPHGGELGAGPVRPLGGAAAAAAARRAAAAGVSAARDGGAAGGGRAGGAAGAGAPLAGRESGNFDK